MGVSGPSSSRSWITSSYLPESLERLRRPAAVRSHEGESVGSELVVVLVDSVRDGTSGSRRRRDDRDDPVLLPLRAGARSAAEEGSSSSIVSHPPSFAAASSSGSSSERRGEWDNSGAMGEGV